MDPPCLADDHAGKGVSDKYRRSILESDRTARCLDACLQRGQRVLDDGCIEAGLLQQANHLRPARAIGISAMDEDDVANPGAHLGADLGARLGSRLGGAGQYARRHPGDERGGKSTPIQHDRGFLERLADRARISAGTRRKCFTRRLCPVFASYRASVTAVTAS